MANGISTGNPCGFNKGCSSKYCVGSQVQQTPEEGWRTYRLKRVGNKNKDEDNSPKILNDKNHQAPSQKFRQLIQLKNKKILPFYDIFYSKHLEDICLFRYKSSVVILTN